MKRDYRKKPKDDEEKEILEGCALGSRLLCEGKCKSLHLNGGDCPAYYKYYWDDRGRRLKLKRRKVIV